MHFSTATAIKIDPAEGHETGTVQSDDRMRKPDRPSNVVPLPCTEPKAPSEEHWQPPKEVIWFGNPLTLFALSAAQSMSASERETVERELSASR
jgi:hypothetical protein